MIGVQSPGVAVMVGGPVVNASSTTQHCVIISTSEAEYVAMVPRAKTALFTKAVLDFLQPELANETIDLFEDNRSPVVRIASPAHRLCPHVFREYQTL